MNYNKATKGINLEDTDDERVTIVLDSDIDDVNDDVNTDDSTDVNDDDVNVEVGVNHKVNASADANTDNDFKKAPIETRAEVKTKTKTQVKANNNNNSNDINATNLLLGKGSFSRVYKTAHNSAIKVQNFKLNEFIPTQILIENNILMNSKHPNIVLGYSSNFNRHDVKLKKKHVSTLEMELCEANLKEWFLKNRNNPAILRERVVKFFHNVLSGLDYLHKRHIIHGDLKLQNILIVSDSAKLCDYGLSQYIFNGQGRGLIAQTCEYRAPEVILHYPYYDERIDIWSYGIVLLKIVFGIVISNRINDLEDIDVLFDFIRVLGAPLTDSWKNFITGVVKNNALNARIIDKLPFLLPHPDGQELKLASLIKHRFASEYNQALEIYGEEQVSNIIDLIQKCLSIDFNQRMRSYQLLEHPLFKSFKRVDNKINMSRQDLKDIDKVIDEKIHTNIKDVDDNNNNPNSNPNLNLQKVDNPNDDNTKVNVDTKANVDTKVNVDTKIKINGTISNASRKIINELKEFFNEMTETYSKRFNWYFASKELTLDLTRRLFSDEYAEYLIRYPHKLLYVAIAELALRFNNDPGESRIATFKKSGEKYLVNNLLYDLNIDAKFVENIVCLQVEIYNMLNNTIVTDQLLDKLKPFLCYFFV